MTAGNDESSHSSLEILI